MARRFGSAMISKADCIGLVYAPGHIPVKAYSARLCSRLGILGLAGESIADPGAQRSCRSPELLDRLAGNEHGSRPAGSSRPSRSGANPGFCKSHVYSRGVTRDHELAELQRPHESVGRHHLTYAQNRSQLPSDQRLLRVIRGEVQSPWLRSRICGAPNEFCAERPNGVDQDVLPRRRVCRRCDECFRRFLCECQRRRGSRECDCYRDSNEAVYHRHYNRSTNVRRETTAAPPPRRSADDVCAQLPAADFHVRQQLRYPGPALFRSDAATIVRRLSLASRT